MTEDGRTPLHFAASRCQAEVCALLLREGASRKVRDTTGFRRTPLSYALCPADLREDGGLLINVLPAAQSTRTIREFLRAGEDFADVVEDKTLRSLVGHEPREDADLSSRTSIWLLTEIFPAINPALLDRECWKLCLSGAVYSNGGHPLLPEILRHCDTSLAQFGILEWVYSLQSGYPCTWQNGKLRDLQMLFSKSGSLAFVQDGPFGTKVSPLLLATRYSWSFKCFRAALRTIDIDILKLARAQVEIHPDGWAQERLLSLCFDQTEMSTMIFLVAHKCRLCAEYHSHPDQDDLVWQRRVIRIKTGVDVDGPLSEEEEKEQRELNNAIVDYENGICLRCHEKKKESWKSWNPFR